MRPQTSERMMSRLLCSSLCLALWMCGAMAYRSPRLSAKMIKSAINDSRPAILGGVAHPCYRKCVAGETRICNYEFTMTEYTTMAIACDNCPYTASDCLKPGCITAGGETREVKVVNHMLPGPSIQVCRGDTIQVALSNAFGSEATTIHWHGMYQKETPFMDGVPYLTQCPIQPASIFVYNFTASPTGTFMWHSHIGLQEPDGVFGSIVVREANDMLKQYYDHDLPEHVMIIWHWYGQPTSTILKSTFFRSVVAKGHALIINGYTVTEQFTLDGVNYTTPRASFNVTEGLRYRFRSIANTAIYCPVQVSVDNHTLLVVATDGTAVIPVSVDSFIINSGERFDFILTANQTAGNYWIRYRGLGNCESTSTYTLAVLHYNNATQADPTGGVTYNDTARSGVLLNPTDWPVDYPNNTLIMLSDLKSNSSETVDVSGTPDNTFYFTLGINKYTQFETPGPWAQINNISFDYPAIPLLTQYTQINEQSFCTPTNRSAADCLGDYCTCPVVYSVKLGALVEMVFIDNGTLANVSHPMHIHGGHVRVVAMAFGNGTFTLDQIKADNAAGAITKNFDTAPLKDDFSVPSRGYTIVRYNATNPGYWFFHCHVAAHQEEGMSFVLKIGQDSEMIHPENDFDTCGDYNITAFAPKHTTWDNHHMGRSWFNPGWNAWFNTPWSSWGGF